MIIYLLELFVGIIICNYIQSKTTKDRNKKIGLVILITFLSFIGGFRALSIGTDIGVYGKKYFDLAVSSNSYFEYLNLFTSTEPGYLLLNFMVSRFTDNLSFFFFILQLMCNTLIILTLYHYKKECPLWMSYTVYFCFFYGLTFNIMRQSCALAIMFWAIRYIHEKNWIKYFISIFLAFSFHSTALVAGILIFMIQLICKKENKARIYTTFLIIICSIFSLIYIKDLIPLLYKFGIINERIYNYMFTFLNGTIDISWGETVFQIIFMIIAFLSLRKYKDKFELNYFFVVTMIINFVLFQFRILISYAHRFSFYFGYMNILLFPQCFESMNIKFKGINISKIVFVMLCLMFFIYKFIILGNSQIYPYKFIFSGGIV